MSDMCKFEADTTERFALMVRQGFGTQEQAQRLFFDAMDAHKSEHHKCAAPVTAPVPAAAPVRINTHTESSKRMSTGLPFSLPAAIPSEFASADSFRGRLVLITVTGYERDVPNVAEPGKTSDRVTATVTTVDGKGKVQIYAQKAPTGQFLDGPEHAGVWFSQKRIREAVAPDKEQSLGRTTLGVLETYKPGKIAGLGNPWGVVEPTPEQIKVATEFVMNGAAANATASAPDPEDPWGAEG